MSCIFEQMWQLETGDSLIKNSTSEKLLGVKIDNKLSSDDDVEKYL